MAKLRMMDCEPMPSSFPTWEKVTTILPGYTGKDESIHFPIYRLKVYGGWLIMADGHRETTLCFYPDSKHVWLNKEYDPMKEWQHEPEDLRDDWPHARQSLPKISDMKGGDHIANRRFNRQKH